MKENLEAIKDGWCPGCEPGKLTPMIEECSDCESNPLNCQTCTNPTKYPIGFWDGKDSHGQIFECNNLDCEIKQENIEKALAIEEKRTAVVEENSRNNIQMLLIKMKRKELQITIMKMSQLLGISPSTYSCYETCRNVVPLEIVDGINAIFRTENIKGKLGKNTEKINMSAKEIVGWMKEVKEVYNN